MWHFVSVWSHLAAWLFPYDRERDSKMWRSMTSQGTNRIRKKMGDLLKEAQFSKKLASLTFKENVVVFSAHRTGVVYEMRKDIKSKYK